MLRYLKAAFLFSPRISILGRIPINLVLLAGSAILGFVRPEFLLLGMGLETAYLFSFASNKRFQRLVDATDAALENTAAEHGLESMIARLKPASKVRWLGQERKCARILEAYTDSSAPAVLASENSKALRTLLYAYVALLLNRDKMETLNTETAREDLAARISALKAQLAQESVPETVRATLKATLEILNKRQENQASRATALSETDSALARIEAQLELAFENAMMPGRQYSIAADIEVASQLLDEQSFVELSHALTEIEGRGGISRVRV